MSTKQRIITGTLLTVVLAAGLLFSGTKTIYMSTTVTENYNKLIVSGNGTELNPIIIDGNGMTVQCLELKGQWIYVSNIIVDGCQSHGVLITGQHIDFSNSIVRHTNQSNFNGTACTGSGSWGSGIKVQVGGQYVTIQNNEVYENCGEGIATTRGVNVFIYHNVIRDNFSVNLYIDNSPYTTATYNTSTCSNSNYYRNGQPAMGIGLGIESYSGWGNQMHDINIQNNTIENCKPVRLYAEVGGGVQNVTISNNTFIGVTQPFVNVAGAVTVNNVAGTGTPVTPTLTPSPSAVVATTTSTIRPPTATSTKAPTITASKTPVIPTQIPTYECLKFPAHNQTVCLP